VAAVCREEEGEEGGVTGLAATAMIDGVMGKIHALVFIAMC
jgi:hypothetical protein